MSMKSDKVQKYISEIGSKTQKYLLLGTSRTSSATDNSNTSSLNLWRDSQITYRIGKNDVVGVVPNVSWNSGTVYTPWSSANPNTGSFYVHNKINGIVYLCLSDNTKNRKDLRGQSSSTITPSHTVGIQRYEDGYEWLALYKITPSLSRFITSIWIPVISLNDFEFDTTVTKYSQVLTFCDGASGACGYCGVYFKQNNILPATSSTNDTYLTGELFTTLNDVFCYDCFTMFDDADKFVSIFYGSDVPPSSITIDDKLDEIGTHVNNNELASSSPYTQLYEMAINSPNDGALLSCFINLSSFTENELVVTSANPEFTISTATGSSAAIRLTTHISLSGSHVVDGIELLDRGSGYYDVDLMMISELFPNIDVDLIIASIDLNFDKIDNIGVDPVSTLECGHVSTDIRISTDQLYDNNITVPEVINFYGFVDNPLVTTNDGIVPAGTDISKYQSSVQTNNTKIKINKVDGDAPSIGTNVLLNNIDGSNTMYNLNVTNTSDETFTEIILELNGVDTAALSNFNLTSNTITIQDDTNSYTVTEYHEVPPIVQYSGNISFTKTIPSQILTSASGEVTKIIRINRIEAL